MEMTVNRSTLNVEAEKEEKNNRGMKNERGEGKVLEGGS